VLTSAEVRESVERAERRFVDACTRATDDHWGFQPAGDGDRAWTISQVVEHVTGANERLLRVLGNVVTSPRRNQALDFEDEDMPFIFYGGGGPAPPGLKPPTGTRAKDDSITAYRATAQAILDWYDAVDVDLRACASVHPAFGLFDGAQWLLFAAVHTQQHRGQILDVMLEADRTRAAGARPAG
jgi:uncharacterized damage-inducible protein DinB